MRARCVSSIAAVLVASVSVAHAQTPPTKPEPAAGPSLGVFDIGYRGGNVTGDEARFERYRGLRPGVATWFEVDKKTDAFRAKADAFNVGYRDQSYNGYFTNGQLSVNGMFDSIPLNYLSDAPLIWTHEGSGRFTLPLALPPRQLLAFRVAVRQWGSGWGGSSGSLRACRVL